MHNFEYLMVVLVLNQALVTFITEYLQFSERCLWIREYFADTCEVDNHPTGIKKGQKLVGSYTKANRYIQESLSCPICLGKYITFVNGLIVGSFIYGPAGFMLILCCVLAGVVNKKLFS